MQLMRSSTAILCAMLTATAALAQGPVAHWPLDEGQGDSATDVVGGLQLRLEAVEWVEAKLGPALSFDGKTSRASCELADALKPAGPLTVSLWARRTRAGDYQQLVDAGSGWGDNNQGYRLLMYGNRLRYMQQAGDDAINAQGGEIVIGQWHHIAITWDGSKVLIYEDGKQVGAADDSGPISYEGLHSFLVGAGGNGGFTGELDDLAVWARALSPEEIAALYQAGAGRRLTAEELLAEELTTREQVRLRQLPDGPFARDRQTCLLASFGGPQGTDADYARFDVRSAGGHCEADVPGKFGGGVRLRDGQPPVIFAGASNCDMRHGTLEFWARSAEGENIWGNDRPYLLTCVFCEGFEGYPDRPGFNLILRKLADPLAIELAVDSTPRWWYSHIWADQSAGGATTRLRLPCGELDPSAWHHFLISWDSADGGRAWLLVDGQGVAAPLDPPLAEGLVIPCKKVYLGGGYFADLHPEIDADFDELRISDEPVARSRLETSRPPAETEQVNQQDLMRAEDLVRAWLDEAIKLQIGGGWQSNFDWPIMTSTESPGSYSILAEDEYTVRYTMTAMLRGWEVLGDQRYLRSALQAGEMLAKVQDTGGAWMQGYIVQPDGYKPVSPGHAEIEEGTQADPIRFLAYLYRVSGDEKFIEGAKRGGEFVIAAQNADGSWPLGFNSLTMKANTGYGSLSALNDGTTIWGMKSMLLMYRMTGEQRFLDSLLRAGEFLINSQLPAPTSSWCEQYSPDGEPAWARNWEAPHACTTAVSYARDGLLMMYDLTGDDKYLEPLRKCLSFWESVPKEHDGYHYYHRETGVPIDAHGYQIYPIGDPEFGKMTYLRGSNPGPSIRAALDIRANGPMVPLRTGPVPRAELDLLSEADPHGLRDPLASLGRVASRAIRGVTALDAWSRGEVDGPGGIISTHPRWGVGFNLGAGSNMVLEVLDYIQAARASLGDTPVGAISIWADREFAYVDPAMDWYATALNSANRTGLMVRPSTHGVRLAGAPETVYLDLLGGEAPLKVSAEVAGFPPGVGVEVTGSPAEVPAGGSGRITVRLSPAEQPALGLVELRLAYGEKQRVVKIPVASAAPGRSFGAEAEDAARIEPPFVRIEEPEASGGACLGALRPADFSPAPVPAGSNDAGAAVFEFDLQQPGRYRLSTRVWWIDTGGNSLWARMDGGEDLLVGNDENLMAWQWITGPAWELAAGHHTLRIGDRERGGRLDRVFLAPAD
ncbi:MAG TPA: LamG-like jellyroll fold domain-containing protein [Armatimonadota bacterium]|nr:LamG-like jellyroll fold domain-containing protein [Armatimonadota bacterium]